MRFITLALSALAALASAHTDPNYSNPPLGNPIAKPGLNELVSAGKPYTIEWTPTTEGSVSLVLLRGPSTNVVPIETIAEVIPNSGKFVWTPNTALEPDVTHYGILIVVEGTGQYQWSTQFGISNPDHSSGASSSSAAVTESTTPTASSKDSEVTVTPTKSASLTPESEPAAPTPTAPATSSIPVIVTSAVATPVVSPSHTPSHSSTLRSSASVSGTPSSSGRVPLFTSAADRSAFSLGAVAAGVFAVLAF